MHTPVNSSSYYIKVGCKGVQNTRTCYPDDVSFIIYEYTTVNVIGIVVLFLLTNFVNFLLSPRMPPQLFRG